MAGREPDDEDDILFRESDDLCEERSRSETNGLIIHFIMILGMIFIALPFTIGIWIEVHPICGSLIFIVAFLFAFSSSRDVISFGYFSVTAIGIIPPRTGHERYQKRTIHEILPFRDIIEISLNPAIVPFSHSTGDNFLLVSMIPDLPRYHRKHELSPDLKASAEQISIGNIFFPMLTAKDLMQPDPERLERYELLAGILHEKSLEFGFIFHATTVWDGEIVPWKPGLDGIGNDSVPVFPPAPFPDRSPDTTYCNEGVVLDASPWIDDSVPGSEGSNTYGGYIDVRCNGIEFTLHFQDGMADHLLPIKDFKELIGKRIRFRCELDSRYLIGYSIKPLEKKFEPQRNFVQGEIIDVFEDGIIIDCGFILKVSRTVSNPVDYRIGHYIQMNGYCIFPIGIEIIEETSDPPSDSPSDSPSAHLPLPSERF